MNIAQRAIGRTIKFLTSIFALDSEALAHYLNGGSRTYTGRTVTPETSLQAIAVWSCVSLLADCISSLPIDCYEKRAGGSYPIDHPLARIFDEQPNPEMDAMSFRATGMLALTLYGNFVARKVMDGDRLIALWPLRPDRVKIQRDESGELDYQYTGNTVQHFRASEVFHVHGMSFDGITGLSPIRHAMQTIGLTLATEEYGARFFGRGGRHSIGMEVPGKLTPDQRKQILDSWDQNYGGLDNSHSLVLVEGGAKLTPFSIPPEEAQFLETRGFNDEQIARLYRIPPHVLGMLSKSTSWGTGIEQQNIGMVTYTFRPWCKAWESAIKTQLRSPDDVRRKVFVKHNMGDFLRGDIKSRYDALGVARDKGIINADEWRGLEDMLPIGGKAGQAYLVNGTMIPTDMTGQQYGGGNAQQPTQ